MIPLLTFVLIGGIILLIVVLDQRARTRRNEAWKGFAAARQLGYANGEIAGILNGVTIGLFTEVRGSGKHRHEVAVLRCSLGDVFAPSFALEREGFGDKLVQLVRGPDHQLGDSQMDAAFLLHNVDGGARRVLSDRRARESLLAFVERYPSLRIGNGVLQLERREVPGDEGTLTTFVQDGLGLATTLQRASSR